MYEMCNLVGQNQKLIFTITKSLEVAVKMRKIILRWFGEEIMTRFVQEEEW